MSFPRSVWGLCILAAPLAASMAAPAGAQDAPAPVTVASAPDAAPTAPARPPLGESIAALVNDEIISTYDLRERMRLLIATSGVQPTADNLPEIQREALRSLLDEHLEMQEIRSLETKQKDLSLEPTAKEIDETIGDMAKQSGITREQFLDTLRSDDVDLSTLRTEVSARMAWERFIGARFRDSVQVGDNQVREALEQANAEAEQPQYQISEIFLDSSRVGGESAAGDGARQLIGQIQQGAPFAAVARQFSNLPTAANGGDAGWVTPTDLPSELNVALGQMRPGQISAPIPVSDGVYILQLRDKRAGSTATVVDLKQAAVSLAKNATPEQIAAATAKLDALRGRITSCDSLESAVGKTPGVIAGNLGQTDISQLRPSFRQAIAALKVGEVSAPVRTDAGLHLIMVCGRGVSGAHAITQADIENKLKGEQFDMFSRRYLRDLRNSATIETR